MPLLFFTTRILRLVDGVVRALLGDRTRPTLPPRTAAPAPTRIPEAAPVPAMVTPEPKRAPAAPKPKKTRATTAKKVEKRIAAPVKATKSALPPLPADARHFDTVWIPRILWALAWSEEQKQGPQSAADLARILATEAGLKVAPNNVARAFRDFAKDPRTKGLWKTTGKTYEITEAGKKTLATLP